MAEETSNQYQSFSQTEENGNSSYFNTNFDFQSWRSLISNLDNGETDGTYFIPQIGHVNTCNIGNTATTNYFYNGEEKNRPNEEKIEADRLDEMMSAVSQGIGAKWSELAEKLGLQKFEIDDIREDCCDKDDPMKCAAEAVFAKWQKNHSENANCKRLSSVLTLMNVPNLIA